MFFIASIVGIPSILACVYWWYRSYLAPNTQRPTIACDMDEVLKPVENKQARASASWLSGGSSQRQPVPRAAPSFGQPRSVSR